MVKTRSQAQAQFLLFCVRPQCVVPGVVSAGCTRHAHFGRQDNEWKKEEDNHRKNF